METPNLQGRITEALRYWEPRRIIYNAVLGVIVISCFVINYPQSKRTMNTNELLVLFLLAVLANVAYCAAYIPDIFALSSGFAPLWRKYRWVLFLVGVTFAGVITRFFAIGFFASPQ
jgi:hypothetical protein